MELRFTSFDIECFYDSVVIIEDTPSGQIEHWQGGCPRDGFTYVVDTSIAVRVQVRADPTVARAGLVIEWRTLAQAGEEIDEIINIVPCPSVAGRECGGDDQGTCSGTTGACSCNVEWLGEDCGSPVFCPGPQVCSLRSQVVVVAENGDDDAGAIGDMGIPEPASTGGLPPKPVASLAAAANLVRNGYVILLHPGTYRQCGAVVTNDDITISSLAGADALGHGPAVFDCGGHSQWVSLTGSHARVRGLGACFDVAVSHVRVLSRQIFDLTVGGGFAEDGAGLWVDRDSELLLQNVLFHYNVATRNGGALYATGGLKISVVNVTFEHNSATDGGGLYVSHRAGSKQLQFMT